MGGEVEMKTSATDRLRFLSDPCATKNQDMTIILFPGKSRAGQVWSDIGLHVSVRSCFSVASPAECAFQHVAYDPVIDMPVCDLTRTRKIAGPSCHSRDEICLQEKHFSRFR